MQDIELNNIRHRLYNLEEIKELCAKRLLEEGEQFNYASYAGALEAHYKLLGEWVMRVVETSKSM